MDKFYIEAAFDEGFPYEWATHHLKIYLTNHESVSPEKFIAYLHKIEAERTKNDMQ